MLLTSSAVASAAELIGDADNGRAVYTDMDRGHCALCHQLPVLNLNFEGNIGPNLGAVGARLSTAELRARIINPQRSNPDTIMPAYHRIEGLRQVQSKYQGQPILTLQEIEDLVAFLAQQQGSAP
ncbi:MAG: sulfur oxidation c-type cytochrome SoxX [Pseudomonadales bacterium]